MTSRADDFGVRYDDDAGRRGGNGADADHQGVDYDLGYADPGWDTQGFRRAPALADQSRAVADPPRGNEYSPVHGYRRTGNGGRRRRDSGYPDGGYPDGGSPGSDVDPHATQAMDAVGLGVRQRPAETTRQFQPDTRPRRHGVGPGGPGGPAGPGGPGGPAGPGGPGGPGGPRRPGRRGRDKPVKVKGSWWRHWTLMKALGVLLSIIGGLIMLGAIGVVILYNKTAIPSSVLVSALNSQSVVTYADSNQVIGTFGTTDRKEVTYNELTADPGNYVINATLAAEDRHFWTEGGISPTGILRAAYEDVTGGDGSTQGGSTITQEFVRNYYDGIGTQQTASRKIKEIFVAIKVARSMSKQWILTSYLNTIYLGQGAYGIGAAAETYFGKPVSDLTAPQAAVLAAIIQQPSTYPLEQYRPQLVARWHYVLDGMVQMGNLSAAQAASMKFPKMLDAAPQSVGPDPWDPYVLSQVEGELESVYGYSERDIDNDGLRIETTISRSQMVALYAAVKSNVALMNQGGADGGTGSQFDSYMHIGAVLENPANGAILAMYPGPGQNYSVKKCIELDCDMNTTLSREQVGSSFKPYVLATAVSQGMDAQDTELNGFSPLWVTPDTTMALQLTPSATSAQTALPGADKITNDSNANYGGVNPQLAMAASVNSAYTDLAHRVGTVNVVSMAQTLGVNVKDSGKPYYGSDLDAEIHGVGMALGIASLTVTEQATMLATIDDNGIYHSAHIIQQITASNGQGGSGTVTQAKITTHNVFSADPTLNAEEDSQVQWAMSKDDTEEGTAPDAALSNGQEIIAKTGTTNTAQSAFFIGAIPKYALAVGMFTNQQNGAVNAETLNNLGAPVYANGGFGGTWPAMIWHTYAENEWVPFGVEEFQPVTFTGTKWDQLSAAEQASLSQHKKSTSKKHTPTGQPSAYPSPTATCSGNQITVACNPVTSGGPANGAAATPSPTPSSPLGGLNTPDVTAGTRAGAAAAGAVVTLPLTLLWVRRRGRKKRSKRG